ncbi:sigma-54 dependent transcriptional regulator [Pseudobacteriovorax antillogorgiicola]|uniref:DNA-binding transcriptional response regulator, NtrC family, contains REC, AAA-type ATPase, and a Fis-type DNA-binding domains n=1 Tax=Pseudobacteriovorax antillogorgiicola TaxID=1513793 RepID=A0A1Y6CN87_9BACT|nr:sigma-54 dependent transcriptional regulator [Pseudobacteriovorax antillogorgiicola]TCS44388.1 DNA-binding NtrC family response regulator [Pseudobacteriovorax antillogorgiicola]SMF79346.1 DNA-binding transcriptional response regulator, NtrC family, contains REC, AAA-type ATPase, and a Fis-type DNA-binding domains [Pseudobacteriovorax antillogorgiicola]
MTNIMVLDFEGSFEEHLDIVRGSKVSYVKSTLEMYELCQEDCYEAAIIDFDHPLAHVDSVEKIKSVAPGIHILGLSTIPDVQLIVKAVQSGAGDFIAKPASNEEIKSFLDIVRRTKVLGTSPHATITLRDGRPIIGNSNPIRQVFTLIERLSKVDTTVLIRGESGTGKELVAQALHNNSSRKDQPFVAVNCGAIPENLIESELFGFERGTFTGADRRKVGKFQFANRGTIFLDEIGDVSPQMQVKLLRALQEKKVTPVGSHEEIPIDVRVISATNKPLETMVKEETFRSDLYYRLNVMPIHLPPLRDRTDDIEALCQFMIEKFNHLHSRSIQGLSIESLDLLRSYSWPGNVRELENVIEHAFIIESTQTIHREALPHYIVDQTGPDMGSQSNGEGEGFPLFSGKQDDLKYPMLKEQFEKEFIKTALKTYRGRINLTAEQTQMTKVTLLRKLEKYDINPKDFQH